MLPINPARIPELFREARQLQEAGRVEAAAEGFRRILAVKPDLAEAHFQLGRIALARRVPQEAAGHFARAASHRPQEAAIWQMYAEAVRQMDDKAETNRLLSRAKAAQVPAELYLKLQQTLGVATARTRTSAGGAPPGEIRKAIEAVQSGRFDVASKITGKLLSAHPDVAILHDIRAVADAALGRPDAAEASWKRAIALDPNYAEAYAKYGRFLTDRGAAPRAIPVLRKALEIAPRQPDATAALGLALEAEGQFAEARGFLSRALALNGGQKESRLALARCHAALEDHAAAVSVLEDADAGDPEALDLRASSLLSLGRENEARALYEDAFASEGRRTELLVGKAHLLQRIGDFDAADALLREAIGQKPLDGDIYRILVNNRKLRPEDPVIAEMERVWTDESLSDAGRASLGFALAKALEDVGAYDRVFTYLRPANDLMRDLQPYDIARRRREVEKLIAAFEASDFTREIAGATDFAPIFVTGLPRSGTTLVEQVLASHGTVSGGGELGTARRAAARALTHADGTLRDIDAMAEAEIAEIGLETEKEMRSLFPGTDRITDKAVQTYNLFGPIRLALPKARFVLVERDPRDTALSMYRNLFAKQSHLYTYSLSDLGAFYRAYRRIVGFWQEKLPGQIHVVRYERFLEDPEGETRALLAHCGLPWDEACLKFHENRRRVDTLSFAQVRQPLYKSSLQAWRRYEDELGELIEAIGDALPEEYRDGT
jgi:tetratricopeptide (TPR) repeat protein